MQSFPNYLTLMWESTLAICLVFLTTWYIKDTHILKQCIVDPAYIWMRSDGHFRMESEKQKGSWAWFFCEHAVSVGSEQTARIGSEWIGSLCRSEPESSVGMGVIRQPIRIEQVLKIIFIVITVVFDLFIQLELAQILWMAALIFFRWLDHESIDNL